MDSQSTVVRRYKRLLPVVPIARQCRTYPRDWHAGAGLWQLTDGKNADAGLAFPRHLVITFISLYTFRKLCLNAGMPDWPASGFSVLEKWRCRKQYGIGIRVLYSPVLECSCTGLRCRIPECQYRPLWCRCPARVFAVYVMCMSNKYVCKSMW